MQDMTAHACNSCVQACKTHRMWALMLGSSRLTRTMPACGRVLVVHTGKSQCSRCTWGQTSRVCRARTGCTPAVRLLPQGHPLVLAVLVQHVVHLRHAQRQHGASAAHCLLISCGPPDPQPAPAAQRAPQMSRYMRMLPHASVGAHCRGRAPVSKHPLQERPTSSGEPQ